MGVNGGHEHFSRTRRFPEYRASGFILLALVGLFLFAGTKIGWWIAAAVFVGAWVLFLVVIPVLFTMWRRRNVQG